MKNPRDIVFEFNDASICVSDAHIVAPALMVYRKFFGMVFLDTTDGSVLRPNDDEKYSLQSVWENVVFGYDLTRVGELDAFLEDGALFELA